VIKSITYSYSMLKTELVFNLLSFSNFFVISLLLLTFSMKLSEFYSIFGFYFITVV